MNDSDVDADGTAEGNDTPDTQPRRPAAQSTEATDTDRRTPEGLSKVLVVSTSDRGEKVCRPLSAVGVPTEQVRLTSVRDLPMLLRRLRRRDYDIVVVDSLSLAGGAVALGRVLFSHPYVIRLRGDALQEHREWIRTHRHNGDYGRLLKQVPRYVATRVALKLTDGYAFVSRYLQDVYDPSAPTTVVNTPCFDVDDTQAGQSSEDSPPGEELSVGGDLPVPVAPGQSVVLAVTNMRYPSKVEGLLTALEPLSELFSSRPDVTMIVAGDGPYHDVVRERCETLPGDLRAPGYVDDIGALYARADVFVHFSHLDGYPSTVLEAYAHRTPVVANDDVGMTEEVVDGETGYLVDLEDPDQVRSRVESLLDDPELRASLGGAGRERVRTRNTTERIGRQLAAFLDDIAR